MCRNCKKKKKGIGNTPMFFSIKIFIYRFEIEFSQKSQIFYAFYLYFYNISVDISWATSNMWSFLCIEITIQTSGFIIIIL